jgi:hypothetical protein
MGKRLRGQMDFFVTPARPAELTGIERQTAVALVQALLTEAVMTLTSDPSASRKKEAGDE